MNKTGQPKVTAAPDMEIRALKGQLKGLGLFLSLEKRVRHAQTLAELAFIITNETIELFQYRQAVLWRVVNAKKVKVHGVSGANTPEANAPYIQWLNSMLGEQLRQNAPDKARVVTEADIATTHKNGWRQWSVGNGLWLPLTTADGNFSSGLWLVREEKWRVQELALLTQLADAYAHAWRGFEGGGGIFSRARKRYKKWLLTLIIPGIIALLALLPVHISVLAPAQITAINPLVTSPPMEGVIEKFYITPNTPVKKGDPLFSLETTSITNRLQLAQKVLEIAQVEYRQTRQRAFIDSSKKADLQQLKAHIQEKETELAYLSALLEKTTVRAVDDGVAVFGDANDWLGRPVAVGEKVLTITNPEDSEVTMQLPVADAINLQKGAEVLLFLNISPAQPLKATLYHSDYEAQVSSEGILAFRLKASFAQERVGNRRIGLRGVAKIYGQQVALYYYLLRKPLAALRQMGGW